MCGFLVVKHKHGPVEERRIEKGLEALSHRGPDHASIWKSSDSRTALGHVRLSIIDLEGGSQPIVNKKHNIAIVVNGEFYDYQTIREELKAKGYTFQTQSDSEILIFLYLEYGMDLFDHLRGEFSFVLYDETRDVLLAGRDRFGIKPLCFYHDQEKLLIASEAKALFEMGIEKAWDEYSFMHAASMQYQPTNRTLFKNIHQLSPGHYLTYRNHQLDTGQYWDLSYQQEDRLENGMTDAEYIEKFKALLAESTRLRLVSDVPVCFHLSGGVDSSSIVGLADQYANRKKHCFTVAFRDEQYSELGLAE
jgi:asparagine synthase (glutamine-hydrolysing)